MTAIRSNKALKYNAIKPNEEAIIELKIIEVRENIESELFVITVQDSVINNVDGVEVKTILTSRMKQLTFAEVDGLEALLSSQAPLQGTYMEKRLQLLQAGLLFITKTDEAPVYFSKAEDWELVSS